MRLGPKSLGWKRTSQGPQGDGSPERISLIKQIYKLDVEILSQMTFLSIISS